MRWVDRQSTELPTNRLAVDCHFTDSEHMHAGWLELEVVVHGTQAGWLAGDDCHCEPCESTCSLGRWMCQSTMLAAPTLVSTDRTRCPLVPATHRGSLSRSCRPGNSVPDYSAGLLPRVKDSLAFPTAPACHDPNPL